jgi:hypothetical protein
MTYYVIVYLSIIEYRYLFVRYSDRPTGERVSGIDPLHGTGPHHRTLAGPSQEQRKKRAFSVGELARVP